MKKRLILTVFLAASVAGISRATTTESSIAKKDKTEILKKASSLQIPFIENKGHITNHNVKYYTKTMGGTVFVEEDGVLTYNLPAEDKRGVVIKEIFTENSDMKARVS